MAIILQGYLTSGAIKIECRARVLKKIRQQLKKFENRAYIYF